MNTLILALDFINDIVHPDGKIARSAQRIAEHHTMDRANDVIEWGRQHQYLIAHVKVGFRPDYSDCPRHSPMFGSAKHHQALKLGTWGTDFHEKMDVRDEDIIITKHRVSAFYNTDLEAILRAQKVEHLIICGTATNMAVEATARDAHDRDYHVTVISDACETHDQTAHEAALNSLRRFAQVLTCQQLR